MKRSLNLMLALYAVGRQGATVEELRRTLKVTRRTIYRDLKVLGDVTGLESFPIGDGGRVAWRLELPRCPVCKRH